MDAAIPHVLRHDEGHGVFADVDLVELDRGILRPVVIADVLGNHADLHEPIPQHGDAAAAAALRVHLDFELLFRAQDFGGLGDGEIDGGGAVDLEGLGESGTDGQGEDREDKGEMFHERNKDRMRTFAYIAYLYWATGIPWLRASRTTAERNGTHDAALE